MKSNIFLKNCMLISFLKAAFRCYLKSEFLISQILMQMLNTMCITTQINFSLRDREVLIFALRKKCSIQKASSGLFFLQVCIYFRVCNSPSNEIKKTMTFHRKFQYSFKSNCLKSNLFVRPCILVQLNVII